MSGITIATFVFDGIALAASAWAILIIYRSRHGH